MESHDVWHSNLNYVSSSEVTGLDDVRLVKETVDQKDRTQMLMHEHQQKEVKHLLDLLQDTKESKITVSLPRYNKLEPSGFNCLSQTRINTMACFESRNYNC